jgi:hypothetical protein
MAAFPGMEKSPLLLAVCALSGLSRQGNFVVLNSYINSKK